ncbi:MAG TPA: CobD/CbiB family protein [Burkholderiales bacterium]|jgi:adenosylcobinamide-phosphate synthase|nr:CobD/CbiB family protein [Burkholderiales bacterium]
MGVLAIIAALLLEQWRPLGERKGWQAALSACIGWLEQTFNGGEERHGLVAWLVAVLPPVVLAVALNAALYAVHPFLALLFHGAVLYLTLGFRQFSHHFTQLQLAVKAGDIERARMLLDEVRGASGVVRTREEVIRLAIEEALLAAHRHVFGVIFWYMLLPGPSGAILYRLAALLAARWRGLGAFGRFAQRAWRVLEWPAARLTAASFAVVGDFEDAVYCWRTQARNWPEPEAGIVLAAGAGAMGVRLGMPVNEIEGVQPRVELGVGDPADGPFLDSTVGLLWRALVVWVLVLAVLTVVRLL